MYTFEKLPVRSVLADVPFAMPLETLLALPEYVTRNPQAPKFNLPGVVNRWLGSFGWQRATKIMNPYIWAPGWDASQLEALIIGPFRDTSRPPLEIDMESLYTPEFPGHYRLRQETDASYPQYEIVHFIGHVRRHNGDPILDLGEGVGDALGAGALRDALVMARTRLLILHVPVLQFDDAVRLAGFVVGSGGPAVLVVIGGEAEKISGNVAEHLARLQQFQWGHDLERYFSFLYLNLIHNFPLPQAVDPNVGAQLQDTEITVRLLYGENGENALQFNRLMDVLDERLAKAREQSLQYNNSIWDLRQRAERLLHRSQADALASQLAAAEKEISDLLAGIDKRTEQLQEIRGNIQSHESQGVGPLLGVTEAVPEMEVAMAERPPQLFKEMESALLTGAGRAPRVLNANFLDPSNPREMLPPYRGLTPDSDCELLVDVGPLWDKQQSIVKGASEFPTHALRQDVTGWEIEVVLVSDDFSPHASTAMIWVPRAGGRSFPYRNGQRTSEPGPVAFRLRVPPFPTDHPSVSFTARGRLCLYYENNLLQSAIVKAGVVQTSDVVLTEGNEVEVDFVLTGSFQQVERFTRRAVAFNPQSEQQDQPIALSLTLNDDGAGTHRIIFKSRLGAPNGPTSAGVLRSNQLPPPGWTKYNPAAATKALKLARSELLNCFFIRDAKGQPNQQASALNPQNGKTRDQFKLDLRAFALLGNTLFDIVTSEIKAEDNGLAAQDWTRQIKRALRDASIIQVARTEQANYVFPWALIYEHPMPGGKFEYCPIIDEEWDDQGVRHAAQAQPNGCPYRDQDTHLENIICPYGFWGLRHIIEQPLSALDRRNGTYVLGEAQNEIRVVARIALAVCLTRALKDLQSLDTHLAKVKQIPGVTAVTPDATDLDTVRSVLQSPALVYFVCHGEFDQGANLPYLGVGLQNNETQYRIYPNAIKGWADTDKKPNLAAWAQQRPLVFINGCHTTDLTPGQLLDFVTCFTYAKAGGILGTEISVQPPVAFEMAERLLDKITRRVPVGQALYETRWELLNKGNLLGLAYTLYCLADLHLVSQGP